VVDRAGGSGSVGLEAGHVTWSGQRAWAAVFGPRELVPTQGMVEGLRVNKDPAEVVRMERAAAIADEALADVLPLLAAVGGGGAEGDLTEAQFAAALDHAMRQRGAEDSAFETIVASGQNSAKPHARPGHRLIRPGDPVVVDFGAIFDGYRSDMTRTFCVGGPPAGQMAAVFEAVADAQREGVAVVAPGVSAAAVDQACRQLRGARHPRAAIRGSGVDCYPRRRHRGHCGTGGVPARYGWRAHRGHTGGDRGRPPTAHPFSERSRGLIWPSPPTISAMA
jgi:Xaa-Pro aminopeptidase